MQATTLSLSTTDLGSAAGGEPTLFFIPGWCGDRTVFDDIMTTASEHNRAVSVDLPGHGLSPSIGDYTSADLVAALVTTLDRAGIDTVIPVALSHAGWPAIELRRRLGERVKGLVFIDWMVLGTPPGFSDALAGLQSPAWADVRAALHRMWTADLALPRLTTYVNSMADYGQEHWSRAGARSPRRSQTSPCRSLLWRRSSPAPPSTSMPSPPMSPIWRRRRRTPQSIPGSRCSASRPTATSHRSRSPEQWLT